jgi:ankyrin repeat protein
MCDFVNQNGDTHLILVIISGNETEAINVINRGNSHPEVVNSYGDTALLLAIHYSMVNLANRILETDLVLPGYDLVLTIAAASPPDCAFLHASL